MKKITVYSKKTTINKEIQKQTVQLPRTNVDEVPLIVPGNTDKNGGDSRPWARQPRERMKETTRQTSLHCFKTPSFPILPPAKWITNGEQGQNKTWKNYFSPKAVNAAMLPAPRHPPRALSGAAWLLAVAGTLGVALTSSVVAAGSSGQARPLPSKWDFEMLESRQRTEGRGPCLRPLFLKARSTPPRFVNWNKTQRLCFWLQVLKRQ